MMLKRKNEEDAVTEQPKQSATKRLALDAEAMDEDTDVKDGEEELVRPEKETHTSEEDDAAKKILSYKVYREDPTFVHFRMLCQVKEAALIVGKGGETISQIKEKSDTLINVSENIRGVMQRVVNVKGPAEQVAKAFGLIVRAILDEDEEPSSATSGQFELKILIPHPIMGYVIGKQGLKFREIEGKSAAKLSTNPENMLYSTDRLLTITGVADSIHIATYYVALTVLEHKHLINQNFIYYNPATAQQVQNQQAPQLQPMFNNFMHYGNMPMNQNQFMPFGNNRFNNNQRNNVRHRYVKQQPLPHNHQYQHFNNIPPPMPRFQVHQTPQIVQEIYIPDEYVGNIIGKNGKNIKHINERTGSRIDIGNPDSSSTERKITITGFENGNQQAILLINSRIEADRLSNEAKARNQANENKSLE